jgi:hypothetical protein
VALAGVIAIHLLLLVTFLLGSVSRRASVRPLGAITALILVPAPASRRRLVDTRQTRLPHAVAAPAIMPLPLPDVTPELWAPDLEPAPTDWAAAAQGAASRLAAPGTGTAIGVMPGQPDQSVRNPKSWWPVPEHHAGEQYRLDTGEWIVWVSDTCFFTTDPPHSEPPDEVMRGFQFLGIPGKHCVGRSSTVRGDLFESLPEYGIYAPH